jgi:hypothetical protein
MPENNYNMMSSQNNYTMPENNYGMMSSQNNYTMPENNYNMMSSQNNYTMPENNYNMMSSQNNYNMMSSQNNYGMMSSQNNYGMMSSQNDYTMSENCYTMPENDYTMPETNYNMINNYLKYFSNINEGFENINDDNLISFKNITSNKLYYIPPCNYIKDDCFFDALTLNNFKIVDGVNNKISDACLIIPCSYENIEGELQTLIKEGVRNNTYGDKLRIFMLNNTDLMASKLSLWKYLKNKYGDKEASNLIPYTWDLTNNDDIEKFKKEFDDKKVYITKNNKQRQEGLLIHNSLNTILDSRDKYILVQELLQNPYLINGRKINLRVYVLVIKDSMSNIKIQVYNDGFMYYTPELFEKNTLSFEKNVTTGYIDRKIYEENPLTHSDFKKYLDSDRNLTPLETYMRSQSIVLSTYTFINMYILISSIFDAYESVVGNESEGVNFQLYGIDIAIDENLKSMIMEINKGPDLSAKSERDKKLKTDLSTDILKSVGLLDNNDNNNFITVLEMVKINGKVIKINNFLDK